jgi:large subunit ribosomal protein L21
MKAIFRDGGRQYTVEEGTEVEVDFREVTPGDEVEFGEVLYVKDGKSPARVGSPLVDSARVVGKVVGQVKGPKLIVMHFRRRKNSKTRVGHRQRFTQVKIEKIEAGG